MRWKCLIENGFVENSAILRDFIKLIELGLRKPTNHVEQHAKLEQTLLPTSLLISLCVQLLPPFTQNYCWKDKLSCKLLHFNFLAQSRPVIVMMMEINYEQYLSRKTINPRRKMDFSDLFYFLLPTLESAINLCGFKCFGCKHLRIGKLHLSIVN